MTVVILDSIERIVIAVVQVGLVAIALLFLALVIDTLLAVGKAAKTYLRLHDTEGETKEKEKP